MGCVARRATNSSGAKQLVPLGGANDLVTGAAAGAGAGDFDIDGGVTSIRTPAITLPASGNLSLTFSYYFAHGTNSSSADYLRVKIVGATTTQVLQELGSTTDDDAAWATANINLSAYAGQSSVIVASNEGKISGQTSVFLPWGGKGVTCGWNSSASSPAVDCLGEAESARAEAWEFMLDLGGAFDHFGYYWNSSYGNDVRKQLGVLRSFLTPHRHAADR